MSPKEESTFPLRLPKDVREALEKYAAGNNQRPPASLNATIVFLLRRVLQQEQSQGEE
jgi:hypothetical protein